MILYYIWGKEVLTLKFKILYIFLNYIQVLVITKGGSRGALLILIVGISLIFLMVLVKKWRRKEVCLLLGSISVLICISLCLGEKDLGKVGLNSLLSDLRDGKIISVIQGQEDEEAESEVSEPESENEEIESITQSSSENEDIDEIKSSSMARVYLYKWAVNDIAEHLFTGLGAYGYQLKYGTYPHNVLLQLLVDYGISNELKNVRLLPFQDYEYISDVFSIGDVGIIASKAGVGGCSVPSKTWSYMSAECAIVASFDKETELVKILEKAGCGYVCKPDDVEELKQKILLLYSDKEQCQKAGENGRKYILENLTREVGTGKYVEIIEKVLKLEL